MVSKSEANLIQKSRDFNQQKLKNGEEKERVDDLVDVLFRHFTFLFTFFVHLLGP